MFKVGAIVAELELRKRKWDQSIKAVKKDTSSFRGAVLRNSDAIKKMGRNMTIAGAAIVGSLGMMVKASVNFNKEMSNVATLIADTADKRIPVLKKNVQDLAMATGKSTSDIAGGLYQVISAFQDGADTAQILEINVKAAAAGMATVTDAVGLTSAVTKAYGDTSAVAVQKVADLAFQTVKLGQTTFPELAQSIGMVTPQMEALGVKQEELFAGFATLTGVTGNAANVSTQLKGVLNAMMKPSEAMAEAMRKLGYETAEAMIKELGMVGAMRKVIGTTDGTTKSVGQLFQNIRALPAVFALAGGQAKTFDEKLIAMQKTTGAMEDAFKQISEGINESGFNMARLKQTVIVLAQRLGDKLAPTLGKLAVIVGKVVNKITDWTEKHPKLTSFLLKAGLAVGALMTALGPLLMMLPGIVTAIGAFKVAIIAATGPIGIAVGALAALAVGFLKVKSAQDEARKADERYQENVKKLKNKLNEARKAVGMSTREWNKLIKAYKGNYAAMAMAIYKGKEGVELQKALAVESKKSKEAIETQTKAIKEQKTEVENLNKPIAKWKEFLQSLGMKTIPEKTQRTKELNAIIQELKVRLDAGEISLENYEAAVKAAKEEIKDLKGAYVAALPKGKEFYDIVSQSPGAIKSAAYETKNWELRVYNLASQWGTTATDIKIAGFNMMATMMHLSGFGFPTISKASTETTQTVRTQWDDMADGIKTSWINNLSEALKGAKSFKDAMKGVWDTIKQQFLDMVSKMIAQWTLNFVGSILKGGKSILSGITDTFKGIGGFFSKIFGGGAGGAGGVGGITGAVGGVGGALSGVWTGIGSAVGTFLGGILGGGKQKKLVQQGRDQIWWLGKIHEWLEHIKVELYKIKDDRLGQMFPKYDAMLEQFYMIRENTHNIGLKLDISNKNTAGILSALSSKGTVFVDVFRSGVFEGIGERISGSIVGMERSLSDSIDGGLGGLSKEIGFMGDKIGGMSFDDRGIIDAIKDIKGAKGIPEAQKGLTITEPGLVMAHGTPSRPEILLPPEGAARALKPSITIENVIAPVFDVTTPDAEGTRRFIREQGLPETINALEVNVDQQLTRLKRVLGI